MISSIKNKRTSYVFNILAIIVLFGFFAIQYLFDQTSTTIQDLNIKANLKYINNISTNIANSVKQNTSKDIYKSLKSNAKLRDKLEQNLQLFITQRYRYIYIVDKTNVNEFRFLLDGSININDKSEFEEDYTPLNIKQWNKIYLTKKDIYFKHNDIKSLWLTYLKPIIIDNEVQAIIAIDFSLVDHKNIIQSLEKLSFAFKISMVFALFIFVLIIVFAYIDNKRINELKIKSNEIIKFNETLQSKISLEVEKNRQKDQQMLQQKRLAQMGEMISMIAHQWRQPLSAITSTSEALNIKAQLHTIDEETTIKLTKNISEYSQHLSSTIDDFRNFFRSNKEKQIVTYTSLVNSTLSIIGTTITNNNIKLIKNLNSNINIETYPNEIKQVILNLLQNAIDVLIEQKVNNPIITIESIDNILQISDNGGGIDQDITSKIFDPYFSTKVKKDGTGLGLYMSKTIIEEHCNGKLSVRNVKNGAMFVIKLDKKVKGI